MLGIFIVGLAVSGATAIPLQTEVQILAGLTPGDPQSMAEASGLSGWL
jgi:hypothetical protein